MEHVVTFTYGGKTYQSAPSPDWCNGCAFEYMSCTHIMDEAEKQAGERCDGAIWIEQVKTNQQTEMTWDMEEIDKWYKDVFGSGLSVWEKEALMELKRESLLEQDPDYQTYLELKKKFENA